jgi:hypothetical protein
VVITQKGHTVAIKIAGTTVISDGKAFLNIESTTGQHGDLHSSASVITNAISFTAGIQSCIMTANQTFTISGDTEGKTTAVLLDTGTTPYVPTFPSSITWNGGEPTWSGHRYWQITIISRDTYQVATAIGYGSSGSTPPTEAISLEGTSGSPMFHSVFAGTSPMVGGWKFDTDGNVYTYDGGGNIGGNGYTLHSTSTWNNITPSTTYYIRIDHVANLPISSADSDTENVWLALTTDRKFWWRDTTDPTVYGDRHGTVKVEISTTSNGSNIVATGYYKMFWLGTA